MLLHFKCLHVVINSLALSLLTLVFITLLQYLQHWFIPPLYSQGGCLLLPLYYHSLFCQLQVYYLKFGSDLRSFMKIKGPLLNPQFFWFFGRKHSISNPPYSEKYLFLTASLSHFLSSFLFFLFVCCLRSQVINSSSISSSDKIII